MKRACDATVTISVTGVSPSTCKEFRLYFTQGDSALQHSRTILTKTLGDFGTWTQSGSTYTASCTLTQSETRKFTEKVFYTQVRLVDNNGQAMAGDIDKHDIKDVLNDEILGV